MVLYNKGFILEAEEKAPESYSDLVERRFERIGHTEYAMSSPGYKHQICAGRIFSQLDTQLSKHGCMAIVAPFDVYVLFDKDDDSTFIQPDIFTACDKSKLHDNRYNGAPKFIIEILSANRSHDMITKLNLYEKAGVNEYWMVDTEEKIISVLVLTSGRYVYKAFSGEDEIPLASIPGCAIDFKKVFE